MDAIAPPAALLQFGDTVDGKPEIIATYDLLGFQPYYYDNIQGEYVIRPKDFLWRLPLSTCKNLNEIGRIPWPWAYDIEKYQQAGFDCLGYLDLACENPELFEYLDNPGLLVLIVAHLDKAKRILPKRPGRIEIVRELTGNDRIFNFHINWLKKVRPGAEAPAVIAKYLKQSILQMPAIDPHARTGSYTARLFKLFAHQSQWKPRGLDLARMLLAREDVSLDGVDWLLRSYNGVEPHLISQARGALLELGGLAQFEIEGLEELEGSIPFLVRERARYLARHSDTFTLDLSKKLYWCIKRKPSITAFVDRCALFLCDADIAPPVVPGNARVTHLDTFEKIRIQARVAENCLWSLPILNQVLAREFDLYAVRGEYFYTISVDRETLDIRMIEASEGRLIKPQDLHVIADWFEECTTLPR